MRRLRRLRRLTSCSFVTLLKSSIRGPPFGLTLSNKYTKNNVASKRSLPRNTDCLITASSSVIPLKSSIRVPPFGLTLF